MALQKMHTTWTYRLDPPSPIGNNDAVHVYAYGLVSWERFDHRISKLCNYMAYTQAPILVIDFTEAEVGFNLKEFEKMVECMGAGLQAPTMIAMIKHEQISMTTARATKILNQYGHTCLIFPDMKSAHQHLSHHTACEDQAAPPEQAAS